jgi:large subunit ribosomal protein L21
MYAIVKAGGKQYKVSPGDIVKVDKIEGEAGKNLVFEDILMVVDDNDRIEVGRPILTDVKVSGEITKQTKGEKIIVFKSKKRKGYRKKTGHRQLLTEVKIKEIHL